MDLQLLGCVPLPLFNVAGEEELDTDDAALESGEVEEGVFAPLAVGVELALLFGFAGSGCFVRCGGVRGRGGWKGGRGRDEGGGG